jgi:hypothetical protein
MPLTEGKYTSDWLKFEVNPDFCRKEVTIKSGEGILASGTVLAADSTKFVAFEDDTDTPATGILVDAVDATSADAPGVMLFRGPALVDKNQLTWHTDNDATDILNGLADLLALGIAEQEGA